MVAFLRRIRANPDQLSKQDEAGTSPASPVDEVADEAVFKRGSRDKRGSIGRVVYLNPLLVARVFARVLAAGSKLTTNLSNSSIGASEHSIPSDLNWEYVARVILDLPAEDPWLVDIPRDGIGDVKTLQLAPGSLVRVHGALQIAGDQTPSVIVLRLRDTDFRVMVKREEFLHLDRVFLVGKDLSVLGMMRSVSRREVLAALIVCHSTNHLSRPIADLRQNQTPEKLGT